MSRTLAFLSLAGGLALLALVLAVPRAPTGGTGQTPPPEVTVVTPPVTPPDPGTGTASAQAGSLTMTGRLSHPLVALGQSDLFVTVDLAGKELPGQERAPVNLALVIDRSGSMEGEKLYHAKEAAKHLVEQLRSTDRLAIVHYGSDVRVMGTQLATPENRERMVAFIRRISDDGGTNIGAGLAAGRAQLQQHQADFKVNRLILISDGQPTEGMTSDRSLLNVARSIRQDGSTVSSIGVGTDFNEDLMQGIAEHGAGAYGYLNDTSRLASIFQKDLQQAGTTVAKNVELSFELPEGVQLAEVLGYRSAQAGRTVRVPLTDFSAGQQERVVVRLSVRGDAVGKAVDVAGLRLSYDDLLAERPAQERATLAAMVTDRREEIAARRDKDVAVFAARAQAALNMQRAAASLAGGKRREAEAYIQQNDALFDEAAKVAGPAMVAQDREAQSEITEGFAAASAPEEVQHQVKAAKAKALKGFGRMDSTY